MRTLRLYALPLTLIVWAALVDVLGSSEVLIAVRLLSLAGAAALSVRESARVNGERRRRRGR